MASIQKTKFATIHNKHKPTSKVLVEYEYEYELELDFNEPEFITISKSPPEEIKRGILVISLFGDEKI